MQFLWQPHVILLIGGMLCVIGGFLAHHKKNQQQLEFERRLGAKSDEISNLSREIAELTRENANLLTGGNSFCYVAISNIDSTANQGILLIVHQGDYTIFDLFITVTDLQKLREIKNYSFETLNEYNTYIPIGTLPKGKARTYSKFNLGSSSEKDFNIFFSARNGDSIQKLRFRKVSGEWVFATKVEKDGIVVYEKIEPNFPINQDGKVDW